MVARASSGVPRCAVMAMEPKLFVADIDRVDPGLIRLRYPAICVGCGRRLAKGSQAHWNREQKTATCADCIRPEPAAEAIDRGIAGRSATREGQRRHERRESKVRARYGRLGGVILALRDDPHSTQAWKQGASGERVLASTLDPLREEGMAVLHDRHVPGSRANIDHIVVSAAGIFVIDAKNFKGRVERRDRGGWFSTDYRLYVGGRDKTALVAGMAKQADAVRAVLAPDMGGLPLTQAICFVGADWSLFARPLQFGDVHVLWPRALRKLLRTDGLLTSELIAQVERRLAFALPPA
jgi:hypothetical protein